jgi:hypothetical protein|nr:MAG TPA: hypothetical protein [Caudoviricetes sp.]
MWKYNNLEELYHYGVLGMRWGHHNNQNVQSAHKAYKQAKKEYRKQFIKNVKNIFKNERDYKETRKGLINARNKREQAAFKLIDAAAKDSYDKKLSKTGSKDKALKAEQNTYYKAFKQERYGSGLVGSVNNNLNRHGVTNGNTHYYNHLVKKKGKKYADAIEKRYSKKLVNTLIGSAAVAFGATFAGAYLAARYSK